LRFELVFEGRETQQDGVRREELVGETSEVVERLFCLGSWTPGPCVFSDKPQIAGRGGLQCRGL
jgi:hypothetical protein